MIKHQSPYVAKKWVELIVEQLNTYFIEKDRAEAESAINYLNQQISNTSYTEVKVNGRASAAGDSKVNSYGSK